MTAHELLLAALSLDPAERGPYLDDACAGDPALRQRIDELLIRFTEAAEAPDPPTAAYQPPSEGIGTVIAGRYKLLEQIGEGGMGAVWVAEQTEPVRRKVALKLIKAGMDSKAVLARFEAERQALAMMDHPNIAKVLDGGKTESGRPYFAMELVKGVPFTTYCDDARLTIARRLELFVPVCQAVQHAHQKGIIHRDLKPSNILVCLYDGKPVPKVIDFGLAKAMHQPLTDLTLHTAIGAMMGTPLYMSPEQAEFNNLDVDTRTDIYSLGVILYELLTGTTPLGRKRFKDAAWQEMVRLIKEEEPPKPSARLSGSNTLPSAAAQRQLEPVKLTRLVRGELDWIVMKALEKERSRRYETANGLARDLEAFLADDPVEASPPSARYKLGKFARKHRAGLVMAATVVLLLVTGVATSTWQAIRATLAEDEATNLAISATENEREAKKQAEIAKSQTVIAKTNEEAAKKLAEDLKYNLALDRILLAQAAFAGGNVAVAKERLKEVPKDLRRWEWYFLKNQCQGAQLFTLYHGSDVNSVAFSPDGTRLATGSDGNPPIIWDARTGENILKIGDQIGVKSVGFSPDGNRLATGTWNQNLKGKLWRTENAAAIWDARTGKSLVELKGIAGMLTSIAFSPDGKRVGSGEERGGARIWDADTGKPLLHLNVDAPFGMCVAFSPDGTRVATAGPGWDDGTKIWDAKTGRQLVELRNVGEPPGCVAFSPDGNRIATGGRAKIWDAQTGKLLVEPVVWGVTCVAFSPDGTRLATGSGNWAGICDARTGEPMQELKGHTGRILSIAFSPNGIFLATGSDDGTARVWDAQGASGGGRMVFSFPRISKSPSLPFRNINHVFEIRGNSFPHGTCAVTVDADRIAKLWDTNTLKLLMTLKGHIDGGWPVAFSPDRVRLATRTSAVEIKLWNIQTGEELAELSAPFAAGLEKLVFSPDGERLASSYSTNDPLPLTFVKLWDMRTGKLLVELNEDDYLFGITFSPDGLHLATGSSVVTKIWNTHTGMLELDLNTVNAVMDTNATFLAYSPDGTHLATAGRDDSVRLWDVRTGKLMVELRRHTNPVQSIVFSPDNTRLATIDNLATSIIWDTRTHTPLLEFNGMWNSFIEGSVGTHIAERTEMSNSPLN